MNTIEEFGKHLIETGDLDPLYIALHKAQLEPTQLKRWLFTYWCCYSAGASSYISEQVNYWDAMSTMATNVQPTPLGGRWPRGHERRHFRGQKAIDAVESYRKNLPGVLVDSFIAPRFAIVRERVMKLPQMGPWIAWKVADMLERVMGVPIEFDKSEVMMFDQPFKSALIEFDKRPNLFGEIFTEKRKAETVANYLLDIFKDFKAPPSYDRPINIQEVETILCKFKSHQSGSYPELLDTRELHHGLTEWASVSPTALKLLGGVPC